MKRSFVSIALLAFAPGCGANSAAQSAPPAAVQAVRTVTVQRRDVRSIASYVGTVRSRREVKVLARVPGTLAKLPVAEGKRARAGRVLAQVDAPELAARLDRIRAESKRAATERRYLCDRYATDQALAKRGVLQLAQLDASKRFCRSSEAAVAAAQAAVAEARVARSWRVHRAPFSGMVLDWLAEPGESVAPGRPLLVFGDGDLEIEARVSERDVQRGIKAGTRLDVNLSDGTRVRTSVRRVSPIATGPSRTVEVRAAVPTKTLIALRHGMSTHVSFVLAEGKGATPVPLAAIRRDREVALVFVIERGVARARRVQVGISEGGWTAVTPALAPGTQVAVSNLAMLRDGQRVYAVATPGMGR